MARVCGCSATVSALAMRERSASFFDDKARLADIVGPTRDSAIVPFFLTSRISCTSKVLVTLFLFYIVSLQGMEQVVHEGAWAASQECYPSSSPARTTGPASRRATHRCRVRAPSSTAAGVFNGQLQEAAKYGQVEGEKIEVTSRDAYVHSVKTGCTASAHSPYGVLAMPNNLIY